MNYLIDKLNSLKPYGVVGIKQSFEDEGVIYDDVVTMRRITEICSVPLYVKIGGCEAKSDINNCIRLGVDSIIAPMVETEFSMKKYLGSVAEDTEIEMMFVCETKTAVENIQSILTVPGADRLGGIVFGRSDFTKSLNLSKSEVDSEVVNSYIEKTLRIAKEHFLKTTMGGNISVRSTQFIQKLFMAKLLDKIETRNVVIGLNDSNINNLSQTIQTVLDFEMDWLRYKAKQYSTIAEDCIYRAALLQNRK